MKEFFKMFGASLAALLVWGCISTLFSLIFFFAILGSLGSDSQKKQVAISGKSVLKLDMSKSIAERPGSRYSSIYSSLSINSIESLGLHDVVRAIGNAASDSNIEALYIDCSEYSLPDPATVEALRRAVADFKSESGKPVYAFSHSYSNFDYYLASIADSVFMRVQGDFMMSGLGSEMMFYKGALDKFGITAQVIRHGKFKAAVEPFLQETMSDANREQVITYLNDFWGEIVDGISHSRNIPVDRINAHANSLDLFGNDDLCLSERFVDGIILESEMMEKLDAMSSCDEAKMVSMKDYIASISDNSKAESRVAVIYADGEITDRAGEDAFSSKEIVEAISDVMDDDDVKAVVLRVNSPGGSATEAEIMYQELLKLREKKPLVVSMGGYAASGGYYISAPAQRIFAENNTVTGSIGVFGLLLSPEKLLKNTLGINLQTVKTHDHSGFMNSVSEKTSDEIAVIQRSVENIYSVFVNHVADGRGMTFDQVDAIAQGRVWTGKSALRIGLVDEIGGLNDAVAFAAEMADIKSYKIKELPEPKDEIEELLNELLETSVKAYYGDELYQQKTFVDRIKSMTGVQAYLPVSRIY